MLFLFILQEYVYKILSLLLKKRTVNGRMKKLDKDFAKGNVRKGLVGSVGSHIDGCKKVSVSFFAFLGG